MASIPGPAATWQCRRLAENALTFPVWQAVRVLTHPSLVFLFLDLLSHGRALSPAGLWAVAWPAAPRGCAGFGAAVQGWTGREALSEIKLRQSLDYEKHST